MTLLRWVLPVWALIALVAVGRDLAVARLEMADGFSRGIASALVWLAACLLALALVRGRRIDTYHHLAALLLAAAALAAVVLLAQNVFSCYPSLAPACTAEQRLGYGVLNFPLTFATVLAFFGMGLAVTHARAFREMEIRAAAAASERSRAQAVTLAAQLRPHFLFNSLQSIATLAHSDRPTAASMLAALRTLLERSLRLSDSATVPLREEIELLNAYVEIEKMRFQDRLEVRIRLDPAIEDASVPPFLLPPLVENAIQHAIAVRQKGWVSVEGDPVDDMRRIQLTVRDSGPGRTTPARDGPSIGLRNTQARLGTLFGADHALLVNIVPGAGATVTVTLPLHHAGETTGPRRRNGLRGRRPPGSG